jgi:RNA recognition motif-containing protein
LLFYKIYKKKFVTLQRILYISFYSMNIYVSNIAFSVSEGELQSRFAEFGNVSSVKIITDRDTGKSRGFGFVEMVDDNAGHNAVEGLNGAELKGRALVVKQALPRK